MPNRKTLLCGGIAAVLVVGIALSAMGADILNDWTSVKPPPRPTLKSVTLNPSTTALLVLDMMKRNCGARPLCVASIPNVKRLYDKARAAGVMVWESNGPKGMVSNEFPPRAGEWMNIRGPDKFLNSDLEQKLKAHNIKTVVICGTSFQGVGIGTGSAAAQRGYNVIVPIDCLSSEDAYREQYAAWHLYKGGPGVVTRHTTLTRSTMVKFAK